MDPLPPSKHQFNAKGINMILDNRYDIIQIRKRGISEQLAANDKLTNKKVIINFISDSIEYSELIIGNLNEIIMLRNFKHENILEILDIDVYKNKDKTDLFIVTGYMDYYFDYIIQSSFPFSDDHYLYFMVQLMKGLIYIHSAGIIHGNLNPKNIMTDRDCCLKLGGFRYALNEMTEHGSEDYSQDITRDFAAPEIWLGSSNLTAKSDIGSVGCIFACLLGRTPLFSNFSTVKCLTSIVDVLGTENEDDLHFANEDSLNFIKTMPIKEKKPGNVIFPNANPIALDLLDKMLVFNPCKRGDAEKCITHPYFKEAYEEKDISRAKEFNFNYHDVTIEKDILAEILENEVIKFHCN